MSNLENGRVHLLVVVLFPSMFPRDSEQSPRLILPLQPRVLRALDLLHQPLFQSPTSRVCHLDPGKPTKVPDDQVGTKLIEVRVITSTFTFSNRKWRVGTYDKQMRSLPQCRISAGSDLFPSVRSSPTTHFAALRVVNEFAGGWFDGAWSSSTNEDLGRPAHSGSVLLTAGIYKKWSDNLWLLKCCPRQKKKKSLTTERRANTESHKLLCAAGDFCAAGGGVGPHHAHSQVVRNLKNAPLRRLYGFWE